MFFDTHGGLNHPKINMGKTVPQPKQLPVFISQLFLINVDQEVVKPLWEGIYTESSGIFMKLVMLPRNHHNYTEFKTSTKFTLKCY